MTHAGPVLFALNASRAYGERAAAHLGQGLAPHEERDFEDGEHKARPLVSVRGRDVYVLHSLYGGVNERLLRLLFFLGALHDAQPARVTAVVPYLPYARKDRRTQHRDPVTTRYLAQLFEAVGVDRVVAMDVHNVTAFENAFRIPVEHLEARPLIIRALLAHTGGTIDPDRLVVVSPDAGGYRRAERMREGFARALGGEPGLAFMEKRRSEGGISGQTLVGAVEGRMALIVDDLLSTGTTLARAATACRSRGATAVYAAVTHGLFAGDARRRVGAAPIERLMITDTVTPWDLDDARLQEQLTVLETAPLVGEAIRRLHEQESLSVLRDDVGSTRGE